MHFEYGPLMLGRSLFKGLIGVQAHRSFRGYDLNFSGLEDSWLL